MLGKCDRFSQIDPDNAWETERINVLRELEPVVDFPVSPWKTGEGQLCSGSIVYEFTAATTAGESVYFLNLETGPPLKVEFEDQTTLGEITVNLKSTWQIGLTENPIVKTSSLLFNVHSFWSDEYIKLTILPDVVDL